ncbi:uncharacterized protein LOC134217927 [Armigeres subalbatus]|uniref:uncharacterized protein LOC134217927 n=1 Tax=Armigeres subalbatus TaxID=124917 RepID=UPI002ED10439
MEAKFLRSLLMLLAMAIGITAKTGEIAKDEPHLDPLEFSYLTLWKYTLAECEARGINGSTITSSWIGVRRCLRTKLDVIAFNMDSMRLNVDNQKAILEKHCPNLRKASSCFGPFMKNVKACVQDDNYEIFVAMRNWITGVLEHICDDNGAQIKYDRVKHEKCTTELGQYVFECAAQNIIDKQYSNRKSLSEEDCRMIERAKDCLLVKLKDCSVFSAAAQLFYDHFIRITSCAPVVDDGN